MRDGKKMVRSSGNAAALLAPSDLAQGTPNHHQGHRMRAKQKLLHAPLESSSDHELLEMLLFIAIPRIDVKPLVHSLLREFKTLYNVFSARTQDIEKVIMSRFTRNNFRLVTKLVRAICARLLITEVRQGTIVNSWQSLVDYLRMRLGAINYEQFLVLYLDTHSALIEDCEFGSGTINESTVYVREIVKKGLELGASSMVLVHNHPSCKLVPSSSDIALTKGIVNAARLVDLSVFDHVIVAKSGHYSFRANFLL